MCGGAWGPGARSRPIGHNGHVTEQERPTELSNLRVLSVATGMTVTVILWGVLVFAAIDFGRDARDGAAVNWLYLLVAALGAVGCMFLAIMLGARLQTMMRAAQRSSTRPLPIPLDELPPMPARPGEVSYPDGTGPVEPPSRVRNPNAGKRAARR